MSSQSQLSLWFHLEGSGIGGNETVLYYLFRFLKSHGHRIHVSMEKPNCGEFFSNVVDSSSLLSPKNESARQQAFLHLRPDVLVLVHGEIFALAAQAKRMGIPTVWMYGHPLESLPTGDSQRALALNLMDKIIPQSRFLARSFPDVGKVHVIANGVDMDSFLPVSFAEKMETRKQLGIGLDDFVIGFGARLVSYKRHRDLLEAFAALKKKRDNVKLLLWMPPERENRQETQALWNALSPWFTVYADDCLVLQSEPSGVCHWLSAIDVFAFPAEGEGLGCALLEAMAREVPVVVARSGGLTEPLEYDKCGFKVGTRSPRALAFALTHLAERPLLRRILGKNGREVVERFYSAKGMADEYLRVFEQVAS